MKSKEEKQKKNILGNILALVIIGLAIAIGLISQKINKIGYYETAKNSFDLALHIEKEDVGKYNLLAKLNIFDCTRMNSKKTIAPGSYGKYILLVKNLTNESLIYNMQLGETNKYNMNIKYKLKLENICLSGKEDEWKNANEISVENMTIAPQSSNYYTIYWTWIGDKESNLQVDENDYLDYILNVNLNAQYK